MGVDRHAVGVGLDTHGLVRGHVDHHRLSAESPNGLRHLHPDRPAAEDQQAPRDRLHRGRLAAAPNAFELAQPRHRRHHRLGAVGEDDVLGGAANAVDLDRARTGEPAAAANQIDAVVREPSSWPASVWLETMKSR